MITTGHEYMNIGVMGSPERDMYLLGAGGEGEGSGQTRVRHESSPRADFGNFGPPSGPDLAPQNGRSREIAQISMAKFRKKSRNDTNFHGKVQAKVAKGHHWPLAMSQLLTIDNV